MAMNNWMTKEQALAMCESGWWKARTAHEIVKFQLWESRLCMGWTAFHGAAQEVLGRSVWSHEFAKPDALQAEFLGEKAAPTLDEIMDIIPEAKRIIVDLGETKTLSAQALQLAATTAHRLRCRFLMC